MSRKLAGSPPACLMASMVAMARPAPLTTQPMLPVELDVAADAELLGLRPRGGPLRRGRAGRTMSGWRKRALSSKFILASRARRRLSAVTTSGLISASEASFAVKAAVEAAHELDGRAQEVAGQAEWRRRAGGRGRAGSRRRVDRRRCGSSRARRRRPPRSRCRRPRWPSRPGGRCRCRSRCRDRARAGSGICSSTSTRLTMRPSGPVWWVTSACR